MGASWQTDYTSQTKINGFVFGTTMISHQSSVDGYGTLILPDGSSQEALRIKSVETSDGEVTTSFLFLAKNGAYLGIEAEESTPGDEGTIAVLGANYHAGFTQTSVEEDGTVSAVDGLSLYPNPATTIATLSV